MSPSLQRSRGVLAVVLFVLFSCAPWLMGAPRAAMATAPKAAWTVAPLRAGAELFRRGDIEPAIMQWREAERRGRETGDARLLAEALSKLTAAYLALGETTRALETAGRAVQAAANLEPRLQAVARNILGTVYLFKRDLEQAEREFNLALAEAMKTGDPLLKAEVLNNLGNLACSKKEYDQAQRHYRDSAEAAAEAGEALPHARALVSGAWTAQQQGSGVVGLVSQADGLTALLPLTHDQIVLQLSLGRLYEQLSRAGTTNSALFWERAEQLYEQSLDGASRLDDPRAGTYAAGYLGQLYARTNRQDEASQLFDRAAQMAQRANAPDAAFRWDWEMARGHRTTGELDAAIRAYRRALEKFQPILHDWVVGIANRPGAGSFRDEVGPMYTELCDLMLRQAAQEQDPGQRQELLRSVRDTLEQLKAGELEDYFRDECVPSNRPKSTGIDALNERTAVLYTIPLPDRTELLIGINGSLQAVTSPVGQEELFRVVRDFRRKLEKRTTREYLLPAQQLHAWLIKPLAEELGRRQIDTLVFVPDGALRTVPAAAFHDGNQFLIQQFAIAITPGMSLMDPKPLRRGSAKVLLSGLTEAVQGFPQLDYVQTELQQVQSLQGGKVLLNQSFVNRNVENEFERGTYSIVHIASHAEFAGDSRNTFLLTYDGRLTLNQLDQAIRPSQYRGRPVELLALSACQTAAGDDRAALGLAGVALKAGARSALATLWFVNDQASSALVSEFYQQLRTSPDRSKAAALQKAQITLIDNPRYAHPTFWAPYLMIGNWL